MFFDERRQRRDLIGRVMAVAITPPDEDQEAKNNRKQELAFLQLEADVFESSILERKAEALAMEVPDRPDWWEHEVPNGHLRWLTDKGKRGVKIMIRQERRKRIEWWVKIITPILTIIVSLLGLVIALVTISSKIIR